MASVVERESCPACGSRAVSTLRSISFDHPSLRAFVEAHFAGRLRARELAGRSHTIDRCDLCALGFHRHVLTRPALERLYEAARANERLGADVLARAERGLAGLREGARLLDVGAGAGDVALVARERGMAVTAVEIAERKRKHLLERGIDAHGDARDLPAASFDFARVDGVLEHAADPLALLAGVARSLAPNARVLVVVPDGRSAISAATREYWVPSDDALRPLEHVNAFSPRSLGVLARRAGLAPATALERTADGALVAWLCRARAA